MKIIGLYGPQRVGKTTVAEAIEHITKPHGWKRMSFAQPIREMLRPILPASALSPFADKDNPLRVLGGKSVRDALKLLGTEWGRDLITNDIWINALLSRAEENKWDKIVIDDLRMDNEAHAIKSLGGIIVKIVRSHEMPVDTTHKSELQWPKWQADLYVVNTSPTSCAQEIVEFAHRANLK
jgi:hypothetical protein